MTCVGSSRSVLVADGNKIKLIFSAVKLYSTMESMDHYYEEYVSKRQEELAELEEYLGKEFMEKITEWEAEQFRQYARQLEQGSKEEHIEALKQEAEQEWKEELAEREKETK